MLGPATASGTCCPALGQAALLLGFGLNPNAPPSLQVPQLFNVLIVSLNALLLYKLYRRFFSVQLALLGVAIYSALVNTNLYIRHLLPYDHALFFFLAALLLLLSSAGRVGWRRPVLVGALGGFSYAVYPGYFMGPLLLLAVAVWQVYGPDLAGRRARLALVGWQLAGLGTVLATLQLLSVLGDTSYLASSRYMAGTITQGSYAEGFSFIISYLWEVEGALGISLLGLWALGAVLSLGRQLPRLVLPRQDGRTLLVISFLLWLGMALAVQMGHKLVFYGRLLHFFFPFLILGGLVGLQWLMGSWLRVSKYVMTTGLMLAAGYFSRFVVGYAAVRYPADLVYAAHVWDARQLVARHTTVCNEDVIFYRPFGPPLRATSTADTPRYETVNFAYLYPISCYRPTWLARPAKGRVVVAAPYFMKYPAYQFEGHDPAERGLLQLYDFEFKLIKR